MFKVNNKHTRTTSITLNILRTFLYVSIVDFQQAHVSWVLQGLLNHMSYFLYIDVHFEFRLATSVPGVLGSWSSEGCKLSENQKYKGFITCECNHLTNFALLLDVSQTRQKSLALSVVTRIGCGISMAGLMLTIMTYLHLKYAYFVFFSTSLWNVIMIC